MDLCSLKKREEMVRIVLTKKRDKGFLVKKIMVNF